MSAPRTLVRLSFPARPDYLLLARLALGGVGRALALDPDLLADLKLAVTEACGNAVRHAYGSDGGVVTMTVATDGDRLSIEVADEGGGFAPPPVDDWVAGEVAESGMGIAIMRALVDEVVIEPGAGGHGSVIRLEKILD